MSYSRAAFISPLKRVVPPDEKIMEALKDYHVVRVDSDLNYNEKLTWCLEHCQNKFRDFKETEQRAWYFKEEQDAVMFAMKWA